MHKPSGSNRERGSGQIGAATATTTTRRKCGKRDNINKHSKNITTTTTTKAASTVMSPKDDSDCMLVATTTARTKSILTATAEQEVEEVEGVSTTEVAATCRPANVCAAIESDKISNNSKNNVTSTTTNTPTTAAAVATTSSKFTNLIVEMLNDVSKVPAITTTATATTTVSTISGKDDDCLLLLPSSAKCTKCNALSAAKCECMRKFENSTSTTTATLRTPDDDGDDSSQLTKVKSQVPATTTTLKSSQTKTKQKPPAILSTSKALNMPAFTSTSAMSAATPAAPTVKSKLTTAKKFKTTTTATATATSIPTVPAKPKTTTTTTGIARINYESQSSSCSSYRKRTIAASVMPTTTTSSIAKATTTPTPVRVPTVTTATTTTTTTTTTMMMTMPTTTTITTNTMAVKSKTTENKCKSKRPTTFSKQRELQACSSSESDIIIARSQVELEPAPAPATTTTTTSTTITDIKTTRETLEAYTQHWLTQLNERVRNELWTCEHKDYWPSTTSTTTNTTTTPSIVKPITTTTNASHTVGLKSKTSSLAARKAKLKLDFLLKGLTEQQQQQQQQQQIQPIQSTGTCAKRLLRKTTPLKLSIPSQQHKEHVDCAAPSKQKPVLLLLAAEADSSQPTLVAQRKADLQQHLTATKAQATHTGSRQLLSPTEHFPRVRQLIEKFNATAATTTKLIKLAKIAKTKQQQQQQQPQKVFDMIVQPGKQTQSTTTGEEIAQQQQQENVVSTLKPDVITGTERHSPLSDEGCTLGQSPYSSDNEDNESIRTASTTIERSIKRKERVARSASSDSALGLEVDDNMEHALGHTQSATPPQQQQRRMTLTVTDLPLRPALLPLAEPNDLPDSPTPEMQQTMHNLIAQTTVPSKVLLEERVVEIPELPDHQQQQQQQHQQSQQLRQSSITSLSNSRRESAQSCLSDYPTSECGGVRYVRTPSVVVSDYSDDVMCGITLEEIEYFRAHRLRRRRSSMDTAAAGGPEKDPSDTHSDVSAASSCSNLYFCGSTISALDGSECYVNGVRTNLERKTSDCSTCSASGDEDTFTIPEQPEDAGNELADLLAAQHLSSKRAKKVGLLPLTEHLPAPQLEP